MFLLPLFMEGSLIQPKNEEVRVILIKTSKQDCQSQANCLISVQKKKNKCKNTAPRRARPTKARLLPCTTPVRDKGIKAVASHSILSAACQKWQKLERAKVRLAQKLKKRTMQVNTWSGGWYIISSAMKWRCCLNTRVSQDILFRSNRQNSQLHWIQIEN